MSLIERINNCTSDEEMSDFINNGVIKSFSNYKVANNKIELLGTNRSYVVGKYNSVEKENIVNK